MIKTGTITSFNSYSNNRKSWNFEDDVLRIKNKYHSLITLHPKKLNGNKVITNDYFYINPNQPNPYEFIKKKEQTIADIFAKSHFAELDRRAYEERRLANINRGFSTVDRLNQNFNPSIKESQKKMEPTKETQTYFEEKKNIESQTENINAQNAQILGKVPEEEEFEDAPSFLESEKYIPPAPPFKIQTLDETNQKKSADKRAYERAKLAERKITIDLQSARQRTRERQEAETRRKLIEADIAQKGKYPMKASSRRPEEYQKFQIRDNARDMGQPSQKRIPTAPPNTQPSSQKQNPSSTLYDDIMNSQTYFIKNKPPVSDSGYSSSILSPTAEPFTPKKESKKEEKQKKKA